MKKAIYPGTFDPITLGHIDIIKRSALTFDNLIIGVSIDNNKKNLFNIEEKVEMITKSTSEIKNIEIKTFEGLLMNFAKEENAIAVVRGLRVLSDFESEFKMALMNRGLNDDISTFFLMPHEKFTHISSSLVKEVALHGGDIKKYVPDIVYKNLLQKTKSI